MENIAPFVDVEIVKEGHTGKKFGVTSCLLRTKIAQLGMEEFDTAVGEMIDVAVWLALLWHHLALNCAERFKLVQRWIEHFVIERHSSAKRHCNTLFELVSVLRSLSQ